jgi:hypothetical protein
VTGWQGGDYSATPETAASAAPLGYWGDEDRWPGTGFPPEWGTPPPVIPSQPWTIRTRVMWLEAAERQDGAVNRCGNARLAELAAAWPRAALARPEVKVTTLNALRQQLLDARRDDPYVIGEDDPQICADILDLYQDRCYRAERARYAAAVAELRSRGFAPVSDPAAVGRGLYRHARDRHAN